MARFWTKVLPGLLLLGVSCAAPLAVPPSAPQSPLPTTAVALPSVAATLAPSATQLPSPTPSGLFVDPAQDLGPISPLSFGTNIGPWTGVPLDMQEEVTAAGLTFLRFPGGSWGDQNDLQPYHLDPFIALCRKLGAEPAISVRLLGGSAEYAAAMVRYMNISKQYNVRYWSIGNEPSLYATGKAPDYDTVRYNREWRAIATAMKAVDPTIRLIGPDIHQFTGDAERDPRDTAGRSWMAEFLRANGDLVDIVSIHRYPFPAQPTDPLPTIAQLRANSQEWDRIIPALRTLIRETTGRDLPVAVTEVNSNWTSAVGGEATPDAFYNAIWWGDVLGRLIRQRVDIVAHFAIHGPQGEGWGMVENYAVRPIYYVYRMYGQFGTELIAASTADPALSIVAARRDDGAVTVMLVNLGPEDREQTLTFANFVPAPSAEIWRLDRTYAAEQVASVPAEPMMVLRLPAESLTLLVVQPES